MKFKAMVLAALIAATERAAFAQHVAVFLTPAVQSVAPEGRFTVQVRVDTNGLPVGNGGLFLKYDRTRLAFESGTNDTTTWNNHLATGVPEETSPGVVAWSVGATEPVTGQDVPVSNLTFRTGSTPGDTRLEWMNEPGSTETVFGDLEFTKFPTTRTNATITVVEARTDTPTSTRTATFTHTATFTRTPSRTPTATFTVTATGTATPTMSPSPTATEKPCAGDCDRDRSVTVDELVRGVGVALGESPPNLCPALDRDGNGIVTIDEVVDAVRAAVNGCPDAPGRNRQISDGYTQCTTKSWCGSPVGDFPFHGRSANTCAGRTSMPPSAMGFSLDS